MCGILGLFYRGKSKGFINDTVCAMNQSLKHRGPDGDGLWQHNSLPLGFGHTRLSVLDLSDAAKQPMLSRSKRYVMSFNGEIYNFKDIANELKGYGYTFHSSGDSEVILSAIEHYGVEKAVPKFIGMFAIAIFDLSENQLYLVRDRFGIKPIYYHLNQGAFAFASELAPFKAIEGVNLEVDQDSLALYFKYSYVPTPRSIYQNIYKIKPGTILQISLNDETPSIKKEFTYYDKKAVVLSSINARHETSQNAHELESNLESILLHAVKLRTISDVSIGAFLSGGIDSSLVVALMQKALNKPVKTFTIGFNIENYNEASHARQVANAIGTDHTELILNPSEALKLIPELSNIYDEPFADSSQIPTTIVSRLARRYVTVSLSGDGGDEFFGGYNRYFWSRRLWQKMSLLPLPARKVLQSLLLNFSPRSYDQALRLLGVRIKQNLSGERIHKAAQLLSSANNDAIYETLISFWQPQVILSDWKKNEDQFYSEGSFLKNSIEQMMFHDTCTYLPDDILTKVDRASMSISLEARVPLLDHRIFEFAWTTPLQQKIGNGQGKMILKNILYRYVPREIVDRPKMGFGVPIDNWLRGPLRDWAEALLNKNDIENLGLNQRIIQKTWKEHLEGTRNWQYLLWPILMYADWSKKHQPNVRKPLQNYRSLQPTSHSGSSSGEISLA